MSHQSMGRMSPELKILRSETLDIIYHTLNQFCYFLLTGNMILLFLDS